MSFINNEKRKIAFNLYISYTKLFFITVLFAFGIFALNGKTLMTNDGIATWMTGDIWFANSIKKFLKELIFNHKIYFPQWNLYAGEGSDVFQLYGNEFGDPLKFVYLFFPESWYINIYNFMQIVRVYLCGISFIWMCRKLKENSFYGILAGAITYAFCGFNILSISRHPHFISPLIYFPLLVLGIEKIFRNEKPYIYILAIVLFFISNVYFAYIIVITTIIYVFIKIAINRYSFNLIFKYLFNFFIFALIAMLISSVTFLPKLMQMFLDNRKGQTFATVISYPLKYYETLISSFTTYYSIQWRILSYTAIVYISIIIVFLNKGRTFLKSLIIISLLFICIPFFGKLFNGGGYVTNRFTFMMALLFSYCITNTYDEMFYINSYKKITIYSILAVLFLLCSFMRYGHGGFFYYQIIITFLISIFICFPSYKNLLQVIIVFLIMISVIINSYNYNIIYGTTNMAFSYNQIKESIYDNESNALELYKNKIGDNEYSRYVSDTPYMKKGFKINSFYYYANNNGLLTNQSPVEYYGSIVNPYADEYNRFIGNTNYASHWWDTYCDNSSALNALSSIKYYVYKENNIDNILEKNTDVDVEIENSSINQFLQDLAGEEDEAVGTELEDNSDLLEGIDTYREELFGYKYLDSINEYKIYKNNNYIPIFYTYNNIIDKNTADSYNPVERHELMTKNAIINNYNQYKGNINTQDLTKTSKKIQYIIEKNSDDVEINEKSIVTSKKNQEITLFFNGMKNSENYIYIKGLYYKSLPEYDFYFNKEIDFKNNRYNIDSNNKFAKVFTDRKLNNLSNDKKYFGYGQDVYSLEFETSLGTEKQLLQLTEYEQSYSDNHNFAINMGYYNEKLNFIKIKFPNVGIYTFDEISVICQPLKYLKDSVDNLNSEKFINTSVYNDEISTKVNLSENRFVCLAIPYHYGWKAYLDGKETKIYRTNIMHMGIDANEGEHSIVFRYSNPFIKIGFLLSVFGMIILIFYIVYDKKLLKFNLLGKNNERKR